MIAHAKYFKRLAVTVNCIGIATKLSYILYTYLYTAVVSDVRNARVYIILYIIFAIMVFRLLTYFSCTLYMLCRYVNLYNVCIRYNHA